ncbi:hypothetical protein [Isoptericola halotolerans]|uniref:Uncharacterized protein n=1 Tax=Isoptericola halotolerans TaxID=300560 RepID=A0ABX2A080_9MICO|nr:hypothetical protein [Isoptericola halotolerans]NOV96267.1 hypothetical protein [Isoptericola halotolerans]
MSESKNGAQAAPATLAGLADELERKWFRWRHLAEPQDEAGVRR